MCSRASFYTIYIYIYIYIIDFVSKTMFLRSTTNCIFLVFGGGLTKHNCLCEGRIAWMCRRKLAEGWRNVREVFIAFLFVFEPLVSCPGQLMNCWNMTSHAGELVSAWIHRGSHWNSTMYLLCRVLCWCHVGVAIRPFSGWIYLQTLATARKLETFFVLRQSRHNFSFVLIHPCQFISDRAQPMASSLAVCTACNLELEPKITDKCSCGAPLPMITNFISTDALEFYDQTWKVGVSQTLSSNVPSRVPPAGRRSGLFSHVMFVHRVLQKQAKRHALFFPELSGKLSVIVLEFRNRQLKKLKTWRKHDYCGGLSKRNVIVFFSHDIKMNVLRVWNRTRQHLRLLKKSNSFKHESDWKKMPR